MYTFLCFYFKISPFFILLISTFDYVETSWFGINGSVRPDQITFSSLQDVSVGISWNIKMADIEKYVVKYGIAKGKFRAFDNILLLPAYKSFKQMREKLLKVTEFASEFSES